MTQTGFQTLNPAGSFRRGAIGSHPLIASVARLVPFSGIQFIDVTIPTRTLAATVAKFVEDADPVGPGTSSDEPHVGPTAGVGHQDAARVSRHGGWPAEIVESGGAPDSPRNVVWRISATRPNGPQRYTAILRFPNGVRQRSVTFCSRPVNTEHLLGSCT